jgi:hypothetical protein
MQGYIKGNLGTSLTLHYNGKLEASMKGYSKGSVEPSIKVRYNG